MHSIPTARPRPSKSGLETSLETKTGLEYYNTREWATFLRWKKAVLVR